MIRTILQASLLCCAFMFACTSTESGSGKQKGETQPQDKGSTRTDGFNEDKNCYFGNMHVHTSYSFDAYTNGCITKPTDAYDWAKGKAIPGGGGGPDLKVLVPLDFYAVSDHAEYMGVFNLMEDPDNPLSQLPIAKKVTSDNADTAFQAFAEILNDISMGQPDPDLNDPDVNKTIWKEIVETADKHYQPGKFTTFPAFEWTSNPNKKNLHRVVVFKDSKNVPDLPISSFSSVEPSDLWEWMDKVRDDGASLLAIPHNGNASDGMMFSLNDTEGNTYTEEQNADRARNEPLYEITQIKGTSETHPSLSPNDEFAGFELWDYTLSADAEVPKNKMGGYARQALMDGIKQEAQKKTNPFKYGLIGDSDTHNSSATIEENNYTGKFAMENNPEHRLEGFSESEKNNQQVREFSSGGVAGVWAEENTREAIFKAMQNKETFGTSGTRMKVRFFGGWDFTDADMDQNWVKTGYAKGVPMGGDLKGEAGDKAPSFLIWAIKDPNSGNLDRIQVVKGWVDANGTSHEKIYNVAWSDNREQEADGSIQPTPNTVDQKTASYENSYGDTELSTVWTDPDFDKGLHAFYYVRVLEIPTPRWSTYDAKTLGLDQIPGDLPVSIQERAWSSPIWYRP